MQVGKYQLVSKLATGGMAEVFLAKAAGPMGFEKTLVLKRILPHMAEESAFVEMFLAEARLAAQLNHPNIVQIFDFGEVDDTYYLAMEYIDGPNLRMLGKRARAGGGAHLPPALCAKIISGACEGLAFAHAFCDPNTGEHLGLIHRDISPDNIMVSKQGAVKVVDFGIAKAAGQASNKTQTGVVKGKLSYMPPEQIQARHLDLRVDVYALGVVFYEMLTGQKPFDAATDVSIMQAILFEELVPAGLRRPDLPEPLLKILDRALARERDERYPDCLAFQADLERFVMSTGEPMGAYQISQFVKQLTGEAGAFMPTPTPGSGSRGSASGAHARSTPSSAAQGSGARRVAPSPPAPEVSLAAPDTRVAQLRPQASSVESEPQLETRVQATEPAIEAKPSRGTGSTPRSRPRIPVTEIQEPEGAFATRATELEEAPITEESLTPEDMAAASGKPRWLIPALVGVGVLVVGSALVGLRSSSDSARPASETVQLAPPAAMPPQAVAVVAPVPPDKAPAAPEPERPEEDEAPASPETAVAEEAQAPAGDAKALRGSEPKPAAEKPTRRTARSAKVGSGTVEFRIRPYATVIVDGKNIGQTPFAPIQLLEGKHIVRLVNRDLNKEVTRTLEVAAGKTVIFKYNLQE